MAALSADRSALLDRDGYLMLRGAVPAAWRDALRAAFDAGRAGDERWAAPRGVGWCHAMVDLDRTVRATCRLPSLLAAAGHLLRGPFFLCQVEGREPRRGAGHQPLHRDGAGEHAAAALIFLDPYDADNGATRVVSRALDRGAADETQALTLAGRAGDILVFDADLLHGATRNASGRRRRALLLGFAPESDRPSKDASRAVRNVRMDTGETFVPVPDRVS